MILLPAPCMGYVSSTATDTDPTPARWDLSDSGTDQEEVVGGEIVFRLHYLGSDDIGDGSDLQAVRSAFSSWEAVGGSRLEWTEGPSITDMSIGNDGVFAIFWDETGAFPIGGALAVAFTYIYTSGPEKGEIVDTNIVFNGRDYAWSTDGSPGTYDIESVAAHEIGHTFGLDHTPLGAATMWPYTSSADTGARTLGSDDATAARVKYPDAATLLQTGTLQGFISQSGAGLLHGAHVVALDTDGNAAAGALTLADGSYEIAGLRPGAYTLYAEAIGGPRFGPGNLSGYYASADTGFPASPVPEPVGVIAGQAALLDLVVPAGAANLAVRYVGRTDEPFWNSKIVQVRAGEGIVEVGMAVENLVAAGSPLWISGSDLPVISTRFATVGGFPAALVAIDVHGGVAPGDRSFVVESGGERAYGSGMLQVLPPVVDDTDGDSISDVHEGAPAADSDGDTTPDYMDLDSDGDAILDAHEAGDADVGTPPLDTDGDTTPDFRDSDSDDDSILDAHEAGDADPATAPLDTDGDGAADFRDRDSDADTVLDEHEAGDAVSATPPADTDGDTVADARDLDSDQDTLSDLLEAGDAVLATPPRDSDGDTVPDLRDTDSDDDGVDDGLLHEDATDFDRDGLANYRDPDADDGGEPDGAEVAAGRDPLDPADDFGGLPGEVPDGTGGGLPLILARSGPTGLALTWDQAANADSYRVYRGTLAVLGLGAWDAAAAGGAGTCDTGGLTLFADPDDVGTGASWYYLVSGTNAAGEGGLGPDSSGTARLPGIGCAP